MRLTLTNFAAALSLALTAQSVPYSGLAVTRSITFRPGTYALPSAGLDHPAIIIRGSHITVDFSGLTLRGALPQADPDTYTGVAVLVDGGDHVTIRNLVAHGYKIGILARNTTALHVTGSDLGYNWKPRLYSLIEHESLVDWMSYHHNDKDEWLEKGAGIYLADSTGAEIDHTSITQAENGLMLVRSSGAKVWDNDFSFLSGIGVGLYRASGNNIQHNRIDFCVRGYSHGFYNRGQDSAGILVYEQSSRNTFAYNSVTHGGDGFFLWAGQTTMDTGEGGSNDNIVDSNDFSFAPTNGIEATFSRNTFTRNRVEGNWHGLWGGYSYDTLIYGNSFARNVEAIAIEHGQRNRIVGNTFDADQTAIHLWGSGTPDPSWGYAKHHDTKSHDYVIAANRFTGTGREMNIEATENVSMPGAVATFTPSVTLLPGVKGRTAPATDRRGRDAIIVDEWGPYDWKSPKLWPDGRSDASPLKLRVLGPAGKWTLASVRGATIEPREGRIPGEVTVTSAAASLVDWDLQLTYRGARVVSPRGEVTPAGKPYTFGYARFFVPIDWNIRYYGWTDQKDPFPGEPIKTEHRDRLDYMSGRAIADGVPADRVSIRADGIVDLPAGTYEVRTISDDGVRVWVDDRPVIDDWMPHESAVDHAPLPAGRHTIRVEYYEVEGFAELRLEILRR